MCRKDYLIAFYSLKNNGIGKYNSYLQVSGKIVLRWLTGEQNPLIVGHFLYPRKQRLLYSANKV